MTRDTQCAAARQDSADKLVEAFADLDRKLDARAAKRKRKKPPIPFPVLRLRNIEKVMDDKYGSVLPMGDDGAMICLAILIATVKAAGKPAPNFMRKWVPRMPQDQAEHFVAHVDRSLAFLDEAEIAIAMRVNFERKERLGRCCKGGLRTIGSYDVSKAERLKIYRLRSEAKRKQATAEKKPVLSKRELALIKMVDTGQNMGDLARRAARSTLFRDLEDIPRQVRKVVGRLVKSGHLGQRLEPRRSPGDRGGKEWFIWKEQAQAVESAVPQAQPESGLRQTPCFIGSNRRPKPCGRTPKVSMKTGLREGSDRVDDPVEHAPFAGAAGRNGGSEMERRVS